MNKLKDTIINDKLNKLREINRTFKNLNMEIARLNSAVRKGYKINTPKNITQQFIRAFDEYNNSVKIISKNMVEVNEIIISTQGINDEIAKANSELLNIEINIRKLPKNSQQIFQKDLIKYQNIISTLIENYRLNTNKISLEFKSKISNIIKDILVFSDSINGQLFLYDYIKDVILVLNKERGKFVDFDNTLNEIENSYKLGNSSEALRLSKKIIKLFNITE